MLRNLVPEALRDDLFRGVFDRVVRVEGDDVDVPVVPRLCIFDFDELLVLQLLVWRLMYVTGPAVARIEERKVRFEKSSERRWAGGGGAARWGGSVGGRRGKREEKLRRAPVSNRSDEQKHACCLNR